MTYKIGIPAQDQPDNKFGVNINYLQFAYNFGRPIIIMPETPEDFQQIYKLDALILPGGADVDTKRYSNKPMLGTFNPNIYLEHFDNKILPLLFGKMPIFGICRGLQTLNVLCDGTLRNLRFHPYSQHETDSVHMVEDINGGKITKFKTNSFHHQAIDKLAINFRKELILNENGFDGQVIEAISDYKNRIFAVQFHPERQMDSYSLSKFTSILS